MPRGTGPQVNSALDLFGLMSVELKRAFALGTKVVVSAKCGWRNDCSGTIVSEPEPIATLQGEDWSYWVQFDAPQEDLSNDGPYRRAQVLSRCITQI